MFSTGAVSKKPIISHQLKVVIDRKKTSTRTVLWLEKGHALKSLGRGGRGGKRDDASRGTLASDKGKSRREDPTIPFPRVRDPRRERSSKKRRALALTSKDVRCEEKLSRRKESVWPPATVKECESCVGLMGRQGLCFLFGNELKEQDQSATPT